MKFLSKKQLYLDYASSAPVDKQIEKVMSKITRDFFANPSAIHNEGVRAKKIIEDARAEIAEAISAHPNEIIFTGSGTESDAIAILGVIKNYELRNKNEKAKTTQQKAFLPHIITTNIEHPAVLENCKMLEEAGVAEVTYVKVEANGIVNPKDIREALKENTVLVSVMYANNEIGTIQPIREIAKEIRHFRKNRKQNISGHADFSAEKSAQSFASPGSRAPEIFCFPVFHTDAAQAMNYLDTENMDRLGVDLMSFNSSKIYGPKGVGVLYKKRGVNLTPIYSGGGQEFNLRSGTENVAGIAGVACALTIANKIKEKESARLCKLRDYAINKLLKLSKTSGYEIILNGDSEIRLPNNINISITGISSELLVIELDAIGIAVSERSACSADSDEGSHVIRALREGSTDSIRITLGRDIKKPDLDYLVSSLEKILNKYKNWK